MGGTSRQSAVNCLLDLEESGASGRGESGLRLMAFGNARILRLDVLNDEGHKLVDSFKEPRLARIHMFDASPEKLRCPDRTPAVFERRNRLASWFQNRT